MARVFNAFSGDYLLEQECRSEPTWAICVQLRKHFSNAGKIVQ